MKKPEARTKYQLFKALNEELEELEKIQGKAHFADENKTFSDMFEAAKEIQEDLNDIMILLTRIIIVLENDKDPEVLHSLFTETYSSTIEAMAKMVQLAAIARLGIVNSIQMSQIDRAERGNNGKTT